MHLPAAWTALVKQQYIALLTRMARPAGNRVASGTYMYLYSWCELVCYSWVVATCATYLPTRRQTTTEDTSALPVAELS